MKNRPYIIFTISVICIIFIYSFLFKDSRSGALSKRQNLTYVLGTEISKRFPNKNVIILANPFKRHSHSDFDLKGITGLKDGLEDSTKVQVVYPKIIEQYKANPGAVPLPIDTKTPLSFMINTLALDDAIGKYQDHSVIVSLIGIPFGVQKTKFWNSNFYKLVLIEPDFRVLGNLDNAKNAFYTDKISLVCLHNDQKVNIIDKSNIINILNNKKYMLGF